MVHSAAPEASSMCTARLLCLKEGNEAYFKIEGGRQVHSAAVPGAQHHPSLNSMIRIEAHVLSKKGGGVGCTAPAVPAAQRHS